MLREPHALPAALGLLDGDDVGTDLVKLLLQQRRLARHWHATATGFLLHTPPLLLRHGGRDLSMLAQRLPVERQQAQPLQGLHDDLASSKGRHYAVLPTARAC